MKKTISILACLIFTYCSYAQLSGGFKGGLSLSGAKYKVYGESGSLDSRTGFHLGGYLTLPINNTVSIQPELVYTTAGGTYTESDVDYSYEENYNFAYMTVPVMVIVNISRVFNLQAGAQLGFVISGEWEATEVDTGVTYTYSGDITDVFKSSDFTANVGFGLNFGKMNASARYCIGLANIYTDDPDFIIKTSNIQISLGIKVFGY